MAKHVFTLERTAWPSLIDGTLTDRGYEHQITLKMQPNALQTGDNMELYLETPSGESLVLVWLLPSWDAVGDDGWAAISISRMIEGGDYGIFRPDGSLIPWTSAGWVDQELLAAQDPGGVLGTPIWLADMKAGVFPELSRIKVHWTGSTVLVPPAGWSTTLAMLVVRIPYARPRGWTEADMARAVEATDELSRRVT